MVLNSLNGRKKSFYKVSFYHTKEPPFGEIRENNIRWSELEFVVLGRSEMKMNRTSAPEEPHVLSKDKETMLTWKNIHDCQHSFLSGSVDESPGKPILTVADFIQQW